MDINQFSSLVPRTWSFPRGCKSLSIWRENNKKQWVCKFSLNVHSILALGSFNWSLLLYSFPLLAEKYWWITLSWEKYRKCAFCNIQILLLFFLRSSSSSLSFSLLFASYEIINHLCVIKTGYKEPQYGRHTSPINTWLFSTSRKLCSDIPVYYFD